MELIDRGKLKYSEQNISYCHFIYHKFMWTVLGWNSGLYGGQRLPDEIKHEYIPIFFHTTPNVSSFGSNFST
jgi:hypothetical protein